MTTGLGYQSLPDDAVVPGAQLLPELTVPGNLVYFLLNVGDGDSQLVVLPADSVDERRVIICDAAKQGKLPSLVNALRAAAVIGAPGLGQIPLVCMSHPDADHIRGLGELLQAEAATIDEFWEPGWRHTTQQYLNLMATVAQLGIPLTEVAAGLTRFYGDTEIKVLAPSNALRTRYDTFGVELNDASVVLMITLARSRLDKDDDSAVVSTSPNRDRRRRLLLAADAEALSWSHVRSEFPQLKPSESRLLPGVGLQTGHNPLRSTVFKVAHHGSKHGIDLDLIEQARPPISLISARHNPGVARFPHELTMDTLRTARVDQVGQARGQTMHDWELGIFRTGETDEHLAELGSIAVVMPPPGRGAVQLWRLRDAWDDDNHVFNFGNAVRVNI